MLEFSFKYHFEKYNLLFSVSELQFHPERPEHLFTCSINGEIWHWKTSVTRSSAMSSASG